jgi:4-hydroxybenzoate polyprenyltransferase
MEDIEGDSKFGCKTMPIVWGFNASKVYVAIWLTTLILTLFLMMVYMLELRWWLAIIYCLLFVILPLLSVFKKMFSAATPQDFHKLSSMVKLIMFTGILSMIFFRIYS